VRSWRITIIRRGQLTSVGAILPSVGVSRQVPVDRHAVAAVGTELARRAQRAATDANGDSLPKCCATRGRHRARPIAHRTRALVVSDQTTTITTATGQWAFVPAGNPRSQAPAAPDRLERLNEDEWPSASVVPSCLEPGGRLAQPRLPVNGDARAGGRDGRLRELEGGTGCGRQAVRPGWRWQSTVAGASFPTTRGRPGGRSSPIADRTRTTVQDRAAQIGIHGPKRCTSRRQCFPAAIERSAVS